jgi:hypothetical protein
MRCVVVAFLILVFSPLAFAVEAQEAASTPAEEYAALLGEYRLASAGLRSAKSDREQKEVVERMASFAPKFIQLAEEHPEDPAVLEVLRQAIQVVGSTDSGAQLAWETNKSDYPAGCSVDSARRIVALLQRDHLASDKLTPVIERMRFGYRLEFASFLSAVLDGNPHREIQAVACLSLAQFLHDRLRILQQLEDRKELIKCYEIVFGKNYLPGLQQLAREDLPKRVEALFERAVQEYGDVKTAVGGTVGARAKSELYELRHLGIGQVAPEIKGFDQDAVEFALSDYRGKVVLLYFWSEY